MCLDYRYPLCQTPLVIHKPFIRQNCAISKVILLACGVGLRLPTIANCGMDKAWTLPLIKQHWRSHTTALIMPDNLAHHKTRLGTAFALTGCKVVAKNVL